MSTLLKPVMTSFKKRRKNADPSIGCTFKNLKRLRQICLRSWKCNCPHLRLLETTGPILATDLRRFSPNIYCTYLYIYSICSLCNYCFASPPQLSLMFERFTCEKPPPPPPQGARVVLRLYS